jgi:phosphatidylglycerol:prolipoprotein diacylglycerol transferase
MLNFTPDPIAFRLGPLDIHWYGIAYAVGLAAVYLLVARLAQRRGLNPDLVGNGMLIVAAAALAGGRLYHVIDQWQLYAADPLRIILPPYSGLGVYGGIVTGTIAAFLYIRRHHENFWAWADVVAPGLFLMQAIGRWGNFFNQELYGPPTNLPWGIPIDCAHRIDAYPCASFPFETTRFHPLFLYESVSGILGMLVLIYIGERAFRWLRSGDLLFVFFIWYGIVRFALETLRLNNWTFFGVPTAQLVSIAFIVVGVTGLVIRRRLGGGDQPGEAVTGQPSHPSTRYPEPLPDEPG